MASTQQLAKEYFEKGEQQIYNNDVQPALDNLNLALSIYEELDDKRNYILCLRLIAIAYSIMGYNSRMLSKCLMGIQYCDTNHIKGAKQFFYTTICNRYMLLGDFDGAINYGLMAKQDLETHGKEFDVGPHAYMVVNLNLAYCYIHTMKYAEADVHIQRAEAIAKKNDMTEHNFSINVIKARLHYCQGDTQYVYDHLGDLMVFVKAATLTLHDYVQDLQMLIETFCLMKDYEKAEEVAYTLEFSAESSGNHLLRLEATKLYMYIYKKMANLEKYQSACVAYAECHMDYLDSQAQARLREMDTQIALSIADTPTDLL
ncbi:MAG: hypothetical protein K5773_03360 [Pseudobutyrivibrio sp.]|nr:hypothetical protein [Pseudobutyrivibrio sp.]